MTMMTATTMPPAINSGVLELRVPEAIGVTGVGLGTAKAGEAGRIGETGASTAAPHDVQNAVPCPRGAPHLTQYPGIATSFRPNELYVKPRLRF